MSNELKFMYSHAELLKIIDEELEFMKEIRKKNGWQWRMYGLSIIRGAGHIDAKTFLLEHRNADLDSLYANDEVDYKKRVEFEQYLERFKMTDKYDASSIY